MTKDEFQSEIQILLRKYSAFIEPNCDLWHMVDGYIFYRNEDDEKGFMHLTGVGYDRGKFGGDFEGFVKMAKEGFQEEYGY